MHTMDTFSIEGRNDSRFNCAICLDSVVSPVVTLCGHLFCWTCLFEWLAPGMLAPSEFEYLNLPQPMADANMSRRVCPVCKADCNVKAVIPIYVRDNHSVKNDVGQTCSVETVESDDGALLSGEKRYYPVRPLPPVSYTSRNIATSLSTSTSISSNTTRPSSSSSSNPSLFQALLRLQTTIHNLHPSINSSSPSPNTRQTSPSTDTSLNRTVGISSSTSNTQSGSIDHTQLVSSHLGNTDTSHPSINREYSISNTNTAETPQVTPMDTTTEFLSRLLLLLGSFVLLCLLLF